MLKIYNTLGKQVQVFQPIDGKKVGMYACGPTVYDYAHIGHGRKYVNDDIIKRSLKYLGYKVDHVMNITDVGHLVSDGDEGEDKLEKGATKAGKTVWEVAEYFTQDFVEMLNKLHIELPTHMPKATDHVKEQVEMVKDLFENGYAYDTTEAVYFDVSKFPTYGDLFGQRVEDKEVGVRSEVRVDANKRNPADFVLWFKRIGKYKDHIMHWESPWGDGFPGWHIECSAMSIKYLGEQFDIHTGGEDHISIHHSNEIAQSEGATGKHPFVKYWVHHAFLKVNDQKMSKSLGNGYRLKDLEESGYLPVHLRYFYLTAHYKKTQNFTFEALDAARNAYEKLVKFIQTWSTEAQDQKSNDFKINKELKEKFIAAIEDDFNTPNALAVVFELTKADMQSDDKLGTLLDFDRVLGLGLEDALNQPREKAIPLEAQILIEERNIARLNKDFKKADLLRDQLKNDFDLDVTDKR
ncbi:MAG: cysteine--tRNA ligase [Candidatus Dojkabacteria bacterium]